MFFRQIADEKLAQYAYLVGCQRTGEALLIDPERDVDRYLTVVAEEGFRLTAVAETHIHADFLSGTRELCELGVTAYLSGEGGTDWSYRWPEAGAYRHVLLRDGDEFSVGNVRVRALHTPGHTPEHICFLITDSGGGADEPMGMVSGDFVFVGDTGRPDLLESAAGMEGAMREGARSLYRSVQRFLGLPDYLQLWPGHGAGSACGKALGAVPESTVGYERRFSPALLAARRSEADFVSYVLDAQPEPPLYFGRMKLLNRDGPPLLERLPQPTRISASQLADLSGRKDVAVVDTREDRSAFMRAHLAGALYAPLDKTFPTVTGSYLGPALPVYLLVDEARLEEAIRTLVRIGIDRIEGWCTLDALAQAAELGAEMASLDEIDISDIEEVRTRQRALVLDVRRLSEHVEGGVPGSLHVAHTRLAERIGELPRGRRLLVHCRTGARSAVASAFLARQGYDVVYVNGVLKPASEAAPNET
jgi:hydroxyacylglutathione hydrolase